MSFHGFTLECSDYTYVIRQSFAGIFSVEYRPFNCCECRTIVPEYYGYIELEFALRSIKKHVEDKRVDPTIALIDKFGVFREIDIDGKRKKISSDSVARIIDNWTDNNQRLYRAKMGLFDDTTGFDLSSNDVRIFVGREMPDGCPDLHPSAYIIDGWAAILRDKWNRRKAERERFHYGEGGYPGIQNDPELIPGNA